MRGHARATLPRPALMLVTDSSRRHGREAEGHEWVDDVAREAAFGGVNIVQVREKHLSTVDLIELGLHVRDATADRALLFVNSDVDAALTLAADGIHLPSDGPPVADVRARVGDRVLISVAVHDLASAQGAERDGADLAVLGTVFETSSKPGRAVIGVAGVREVCAALAIPVIAIGGITAANAADVIRAGAAGVAVIGAIFDTDDPRAAAVALRDAIDGAGRA